MYDDIPELKDIEKDLKEVFGIKEPEPVVRRKKVRNTYKITNRTYQPIQLIMSAKEMRLLGANKGDNIIFVNKLTNQINNLERKGFIKIREMN